MQGRVRRPHLHLRALVDEARLRLILNEELRTLAGVAAQQDLRAALHALLDACYLYCSCRLELGPVEGRGVEGVRCDAAEP